MSIGWPEGIYIGLCVFNLIVYAALDGKPKTGTYSASVMLVNVVLMLALLYWGGFFA